VYGTGLGVGIALALLEAENDDLAQHADLRRGETRAVPRRHRIAQVLQERVELRRAERLHRARALQQ
jgi:hypothetical protein